MSAPLPAPSERRRLERRTNPTLAELTMPELRRMLVTTILFVIILVLFLWMVRTVIIAAILGVIVSLFMRPVFLWFRRRFPNNIVATTITLALLILPVFALSAYSYDEITDVAGYVNAHQEQIATKIDSSLHRLPFLQTANTEQGVKHYVLVASNYGTNLLSELRTALESNARGVLYGAIYSTFLTQAIKSVIILAMNLAFHVPLAAVLAILSFIIGFFPIVGSWSVYLPVAGWLAIFRDSPGQGLAMVVIGFF